jgi:tripartite-type tricarboxylate transporter receptor subunit TctC
VVGYLEANFKKVTEDPEFHTTAKEIYHPVMYQERKAFLKNMTDGFEMYGQLIDKLGLKQQQ